MKKKDALKKVAWQNGVSEEKVREDMQKAIHEAYLRKTPDFIATFGDREPSVEEFIENMVMKLNGAS